MSSFNEIPSQSEMSSRSDLSFEKASSQENPYDKYFKKIEKLVQQHGSN